MTRQSSASDGLTCAATTAPDGGRRPLPALTEKAEESLAESTEDMAQRALLEIDRYLHLRNMKVLDLFRMRDINTSYTGVGFGGDDDMTLDSEEFSQLLLKNTQCRFKKNDIQAVVDFLDQDGNGELDILELWYCCASWVLWVRN